jgi:ATP adenylyltransferase
MSYLQNDANDSNKDCIFCAKANGSNDAAEHVLYRGQYVFVTLNLYPYNNGHLMIVPYTHAAHLVDLSDEAAAEIMQVTQMAIRVLRTAYNPQGFNIGMNIGSAAGAGIAEHLHQHIVPRWSGDTNFMTVLGSTRTIPEWIDETYQRLSPLWQQITGMNKEST